jgi:hypothetical protein
VKNEAKFKMSFRITSKRQVSNTELLYFHSTFTYSDGIYRIRMSAKLTGYSDRGVSLLLSVLSVRIPGQ